MVEELHPLLRPIYLNHLALIKELLAKYRPEINVRKGHTFRSPEEQNRLYAIGRMVEMHRKPVTNANATQSPHCWTFDDGTPASCAYDLYLIKNGAMLHDADPMWHIIPTTLHLVAPVGLCVSGSDFRSIRDMPHSELREWRTMSRRKPAEED